MFGSIAKRRDTATSDIDLFIVSESLAYADACRWCSICQRQAGRTVNPAVYSRKDLLRRIKQALEFQSGNYFSNGKLWVIGTEDVFAA